ncbi:MAG TPA: FHA domain-containing protein [Kiritimatiellia bacterium]|nr:FHA domain-containing protein [Kiritimatiellia bacterium]HMO99661.1 FHA domain-containing protein [Kiritimatiellia bacterium]HMP96165.1 FHA domain-containing protein [Kiritimatiellia bacterium]
MSALLMISRHNHEIGRIVLSTARILLGRSPECDVILEDEDVSRRHAVITADDDGYTLQDAGSRNGVAINGDLLTTPRLLKPRDVITIGGYTIRFELTPTDPEDY